MRSDEDQRVIEDLEHACRTTPNRAGAWVDLGIGYLARRRLEDAEASLRRALALDEALSQGWRRLGDVLAEAGKKAEARRAFERSIATDPARRRLDEAVEAVRKNRLRDAENIYRALLREDSSCVGALCGLAAIALRAGYVGDAERQLRHAARESAHLPMIHRGLGQTLLARGHIAEADAAISHVLDLDPDSSGDWFILGLIRARSLREDAALVAFDNALRLDPRLVRALLAKGHVLKALGRRQECEAAYHACLDLQFDLREAYFSLAELKTYRFSDAELAQMQSLAPGGEPSDAATAMLEFALGRAFEQRAAYAESFSHYAKGNLLRRRTIAFDMDSFERKVRRVAELFDPSFAAARPGACPSRAPIFIVGLPRSGSTLVEQILASHPKVEGTKELPNLVTLVQELDRAADQRDTYPESLRGLNGQELRSLGERYIRETQQVRGGSDRAHFVDKMPDNFNHVGLIHLILPEAAIIDVRRDPMDTCFSAFKQYFAEGQSYSYDLRELARYYRAYLELMAHWDQVLPGKVLHLQYEALVRDTETQVRRLLEHCRLPFEEACLRFHETRRGIRTASSEQVRQPMYDSAIGHWRCYEAQLEPLRLRLGDAIAQSAPITASVRDGA